MYDAEGFQIANELNRFAIGDRDNLAFNDDGSLDILIQHDKPKNGRSNWLPAPPGGFNLCANPGNDERTTGWCERAAAPSRAFRERRTGRGPVGHRVYGPSMRCPSPPTPPHAAAACLNAGDWGLIPPRPALIWPPENVGSGKFGRPCLRMHSALATAANLWLSDTAGGGPPGR